MAALTRSYAARAEPSELGELMDGETSFDVFEGTLKSLASVNRLSLGYLPIERFLRRLLRARDPGRPLSVVDIGSGYGDGLRAAAAFIDAQGVRAKLTGVDLNPHAAAAADRVREPYEHVQLSWVTADVFDYIDEAGRPDIVMSSLFCHHLDSDELPGFLRWMDGAAVEGWLVNDLRRSRLAAAGFFALSRLMRRHRVVQHDGPVSFARAFRRPDWQRYLGEAGVKGARVYAGAPFRLCVEKLSAR